MSSRGNHSSRRPLSSSCADPSWHTRTSFTTCTNEKECTVTHLGLHVSQGVDDVLATPHSHQQLTAEHTHVTHTIKERIS
ncbi:hypothetical protein E2C01_055041 [Portunus trituberculatus]|uniref:Uncharacterized protein n=1 Tax=Portunus trituberculatus TaxID=210409 RepID=A0A5B7GL98_PORTR|nr:hypothetical protein [Portunus trituberculatus]